MIEKGRSLLKVPRTDRCVCCNKLEDEFHVICECSRYNCNRKLYIKPFYVRKPSMFKLAALLYTDNVSEMQKLAILIKRALMIQKDCLLK